MVPSTSRYALAYLFWALSVVVAFTGLLVSRNTVMLALGATGWDRYFVHAINQFSFLFLAICGLAVIIFTEHFYRTGVEKNRLFARFFLITMLEFSFFTFLHLVMLVSEVILDLFTPTTLIIIGGEILLAFVFFWLYRRATHTATPG
jgi:hypothetical protein